MFATRRRSRRPLAALIAALLLGSFALESASARSRPADAATAPLPAAAPLAAAAIDAPPTTAADVTAATGRTIDGPLTAWTTGTGAGLVEHVAGTSSGVLLVFYRSGNSGGWRVVDASAEAGRTAVTGSVLTSWVTRDGEFTVEHVAAVGAGGRLLVFYWSPRNGRWRVVDATTEAGRTVSAGLTSWVTQSGAYTVEHVAGVSSTGRLIVFWWSPAAGRWQSVDASTEAGRGGLSGTAPTAWISQDGEFTVEHVAAAGADDSLLVFYWSPRTGHWRVVDATAESGRTVSGGLTSWVTQSGIYTVEHVAGTGPNGHLTVFWWSPVAGHWRAVDATRIARGPDTAGGVTALRAGTGQTSPEMVVARAAGGGLLLHWWTPALDWRTVDLAATTGTNVAGDPVTWNATGTAAERIAVRSNNNNHLLVFSTAGQERQIVDALRTPVYGVKRTRNVRRDVLTIIWDPHKPGVPRPSRASVEAAVLGATNSVRDYYLENSDELYTIESAGVMGWYDSDYGPDEYWPPDGSPGRDSGAEAIRKAAATFDFARYDADNDGDVDADELAILFILPGTGVGGGLGRIVGEDYTTRDTARGITVDGKLITWISEVSIGAPPAPGLEAHELAHLLLGLGDMYFDRFYNPAEAERYSLMDRDRPGPHIDPINKLKLGWLHPRPILRSGRYGLPDVERTHNAWVLIDPARGTKEYFVIENRWPGTSYDQVLPDQGLAIWHVIEDEATFRTYQPAGVSQSDWDKYGGQWPRQGIRLIRPVISQPSDDSVALWDGSDPATGYDKVLRWADGTLSGFAVRDISAAGPTMQATIDVS